MRFFLDFLCIQFIIQQFIVQQSPKLDFSILKIHKVHIVTRLHFPVFEGVVIILKHFPQLFLIYWKMMLSNHTSNLLRYIIKQQQRWIKFSRRAHLQRLHICRLRCIPPPLLRCLIFELLEIQHYRITNFFTFMIHSYSLIYLRLQNSKFQINITDHIWYDFFRILVLNIDLEFTILVKRQRCVSFDIGIFFGKTDVFALQFFNFFVGDVERLFVETLAVECFGFPSC